LDLIISVDTAIAHLAGAMGKPVWVMLHKNADWRWHSDDGVGRWYATSRKLNQQINKLKQKVMLLSNSKSPHINPKDSNSKIRRHCVITGTGRAGTTFLVKLLTNLGLDTGFTPNDLITKTDPIAHAGLEHDIRRASSPYIIKNPAFCDISHEIFARDDIAIDHIFIPIRDLTAAADSRREVTQKNIDLNRPNFKSLGLRENPFPGGLWHTEIGAESEQEMILLKKIYNLLEGSARSHVPITLISYPLLANNPIYLYEKLKPILGDIHRDFFLFQHEKTLDKNLLRTV